MRNSRGALGALLLAGAAYAWRNRDRLRQQFNTLRNQETSFQPQSRRPQALPDNSSVEERDFGTNSTYKEREFGGTSM